MEIYGKEYGLFLTTGATGEVADRCPDGKLQNLEKYLSTDLPQKELFERIAGLAVVLNEGYERREAYKRQEPFDGTSVLKADVLLSLDVPAFLAVQSEVIKAIREGSKISVEAKPSKNAEGEA